MSLGWADDAKKNLAKQQERLERVHRAAMFRLVAQTVVKSPVDTGRFWSNWIAAYGSIDRKTFSSTTRDSVGEVNAYFRGREIASNYAYLTNSLPYALSLEYGHSLQTPNGIVRATARNFSRYVREAIKQEKIL